MDKNLNVIASLIEKPFIEKLIKKRCNFIRLGL